jgi:hypothetical protein
MSLFGKSLVLLALLLSLCVPPAWAQPPDASMAAAYNAGAVGGARFGAAAGFQGAQFGNPYTGFGPYGYFEDPIGGFMNGTANVIGAQGQWMKDLQSASMTKEQVRQSKIDTRRKNFDEWQYERKNTPTFEDDREHFRSEDWRRSRNDPPLSEIWSGEALNFLLDQAQKVQARMGPGQDVPLDASVLRRINVTSGPTSGNAGLLREGGKLSWPLPLRSEAFQEDRQRLDSLMPQAIQQASKGAQVNADTLDSMIQTVNDLNNRIRENIASMTPGDFSRAQRFIREVNSGIQMLQNPNASKYISGQWAATGENVSQLVQDMTRKGLRFAPATDGDQSAYVAVQRGMSAYVSGFSAQLTAKR